MFLDMRYHIFTITAIFLSLGLGILIGSSFIKSENLLKKQQEVISGIDQSIREIKVINSNLESEIKLLKEEIKLRKELEKEYLEYSLKGKLKSKKYLILADNITDEKKKLLQKLFLKAGATIKVIEKYDNIRADNYESLIIWNNKGKTERLNNINFKKIIQVNSDKIMQLFLILLEDQ